MTEAGLPWSAPAGWRVRPGCATRRCADGGELRVQMRRERVRDRARGDERPRYWELRRWDAATIAARDRGEAVHGGDEVVHGSLVHAGEPGRGQPEAALFRLADAKAREHGGWA